MTDLVDPSEGSHDAGGDLLLRNHQQLVREAVLLTFLVSSPPGSAVRNFGSTLRAVPPLPRSWTPRNRRGERVMREPGGRDAELRGGTRLLPPQPAASDGS